MPRSHAKINMPRTKIITIIELWDVAGEWAGLGEGCQNALKPISDHWVRMNTRSWIRFQRGNDGHAFCISPGSLCCGPGMMVYRHAWYLRYRITPWMVGIFKRGRLGERRSRWSVTSIVAGLDLFFREWHQERSWARRVSGRLDSCRCWRRGSCFVREIWRGGWRGMSGIRRMRIPRHGARVSLSWIGEGTLGEPLGKRGSATGEIEVKAAERTIRMASVSRSPHPPWRPSGWRCNIDRVLSPQRAPWGPFIQRVSQILLHPPFQHCSIWRAAVAQASLFGFVPTLTAQTP